VPSRRWVLPFLLCSPLAADSGDGPHPLDRIRMQKAIFLLTRRGAADWREAYSYRPYNWGPYCRELADDLQQLMDAHLLRLSYTDAPQYGRYQLTDSGEQMARVLWQDLEQPERDFLGSVRSYVTHKDFNDLLREVYDAYPEYATKSRWVGRG
jgi:uncharacterized protein YwgA